MGKGPTTEPWTHDLHSNAEFQPRELRNWLPRPTSPLMCQSRVCRIHDRWRPSTSRLALVCWMVVGPQAWGGCCNCLFCLWCMCVICELVLSCSNSKETTQLRRKAEWKKGPTTEPRTHYLRSNAKLTDYVVLGWKVCELHYTGWITQTAWKI